MINVTKTYMPDFDQYCAKIKKLWETRWLTNQGEYAKELEEKLKKYLRVKYIVLTCNGTIALQMALKILNITGSVITTPFTFAATTNVILWEKLRPIFADIELDSYNLNPTAVEKLIAPDTTAIMPVHVYGNACRVKEFQELCAKHSLKLIYDAAHAFGCEYEGIPLVNFGDCSILSFHATKIFNTIEGGAIVINDELLYNKLVQMRDFGISDNGNVKLVGINAKMNEFQAAMGLCNLEIIDQCIKIRKQLTEYYFEKLQAVKGLNFPESINSKSNYNYFPVCFRDSRTREEVCNKLLAEGIKPRKYFTLTTDFEYFKDEYKYICPSLDQLKGSSDIASRVLCLPLFPELEKGDIDKIINVIKKV